MSETSSNVPLLAGESTRTSYATAAASDPIPIPGAKSSSSKRVKHARTVSDTAKKPEEASQIDPVRTGDDTSFEPVSISSSADRVCVFLDDNEGAGESLWIDEDLLEAMCSSVVLQNEGQLHPNNFAIGRFLSAYSQDDWSSVRLIEKRLKGSTEPERRSYDQTGYLYRIWLRTDQPRSKRALHLMSHGSIQHASFEDRSFSWMSSIAHVWPPPLVIGMEDEFSQLFSFAISDVNKEREVLNVLRFKLSAKFSGAFFALVRPMFIYCLPFLMMRS
jgi:hypothetical protein